MKKKVHPFFLYWVLSIFIFGCNTEGVKFTRDDRMAIDTLAQKQIGQVSISLDKVCQDSADALRQRLVDSMVIAREREIMMQTRPNH